MPQILKTILPTARKQHTCMYCGCTIQKGEKYRRDTCTFEGQLYDWVAHKECQDVAQELDMFDFCDEGLTGENFRDQLWDYIGDTYRDDERYDEIINMTLIEAVRLILKDIEDHRNNK